MATAVIETIQPGMVELPESPAPPIDPDYDHLADLIEEGMRLHPDWKQCRGSYYKNGRGEEIYSISKSTRESIRSACAIGFAMSTDKLLELNRHDLVGRVMAANDEKRWSLKRIVKYLRLGGKER